MFNKVLFVAACIVLPIVWGVLVNWLFNLWHEREVDKLDDKPVFPDYQI